MLYSLLTKLITFLFCFIFLVINGNLYGKSGAPKQVVSKIVRLIQEQPFQEKLSGNNSKCLTRNRDIVAGPCEDLFEHICINSNLKEDDPLIGFEKSKQDLNDILIDALEITAKETGEKSFCDGLKDRFKKIGLVLKDCKKIKENLFNQNPAESSIQFENVTEFNKQLTNTDRLVEEYKKNKNIETLDAAYETVVKAFDMYLNEMIIPMMMEVPEILLNSYYSNCKELKDKSTTEGMLSEHDIARITEKWCSKKKYYKFKKLFQLGMIKKDDFNLAISDAFTLSKEMFGIGDSADLDKKIVVDNFINGKLGISKGKRENFFAREFGRYVQSRIFNDYINDLKRKIIFVEKMKRSLYDNDNFKRLHQEYAGLQGIILDEFISIFKDHSKQIIKKDGIFDFANDSKKLSRFMVQRELFKPEFDSNGEYDRFSAFLLDNDIANIDVFNAFAINKDYIFLNPVLIMMYKYNPAVIRGTLIHELQHILTPIDGRLEFKDLVKEKYAEWEKCMKENGMNENQTEETFSDWMAIRVMGKSLNKLDRSKKITHLTEIISKFCLYDKNAFNGGIASDFFTDSHPSPFFRVNAIIATDPIVREIFGCKNKNPVFNYCKMDNGSSK